MRLIAGLGNPGQQYKNTRHNIGFRAVDFLAKELNLGNFKNNKKLKSDIIETHQINNQKTIIAKPQTYMNNSGDAVQSIQSFCKIPSQNIIIIYDELDLPFGDIRVRQDGSSAGHNGIKSIIDKLGTDKFTRIRLGIHNDKAGQIPADKFVLSRFSILEKLKLKHIFHEVLGEIEKVIK